jgi:tetratricopeptide (TPR) repeat protein
MRRAHQFVIGVIITLIVAMIMLSPRGEEHAAMLASEGRHKEAIAILQRQMAEAPQDPDLMAALGRSYAALGDTERAIYLFDGYLAVRPGDLAARKRQAELLLQMGWVDRYLDALARVVAAQPSPQNVTLLIELFRLHGRVEEEMATLQAYRDSGMLEAPQLERLGAMLAERGQWREARQSLDLADQKAPPDASAGRFLLLEVLIRGREIDRVYDRAEAWMRGWRSPFLGGKLILRIAQAGLAVPASRLALKFTDIMPDDTFEIVDLLARKGHQGLAHQMLVRWADRTATPTGEQLRAFVQASALVSDVGGALVKLLQLAHSGSSPASQAEMAEEVANTFGKPALAAIRNLLPNEVLLARPLFAAELSLFEGNREMARWFLNGVEPAQLSPERSANWLALLHRVETDTEVFQRLTVLWSDGRLPAELLPYFADQATKLGQVGMHDLIWNSVRQ